jgi:hypothetical protein
VIYLLDSACICAAGAAVPHPVRCLLDQQKTPAYWTEMHPINASLSNLSPPPLPFPPKGPHHAILAGKKRPS